MTVAGIFICIKDSVFIDPACGTSGFLVAVSDYLKENRKQEVFEDENGELPESIASSALNEWIFNEDTIREVLNILMTHGLKIDYGNKIGKTIIFAKNHTHAEKILEVFGKEYPHLTGYAKVIDNYMTYTQSAIDEFSEPDKLPQIAVSVDMLDTLIRRTISPSAMKTPFSWSRSWSR